MKVKNSLQGNLTRYSFIAGALVLLLLFAFLPACAPEVAPPPGEPDPYEKYVASVPEGCLPVPRDCFEQAMEEGGLRFYHWDDLLYELNTEFANQFGLTYTEDYFPAGYAEMVAKFKLDPETEYDIVTADTRSTDQMKALGLLHRINPDWVPNVYKYMPEATKGLWNEADYEWGVPNTMPLCAYVYNSKYVDDPRLPSWSVMFEPEEKYRGRITMIDDMFETIAAALIYLGYSQNSDDEGELMEAKEVLLRQKPYLMAYDGWPRRQYLEEDAWIIHTWGGDGVRLQREMESSRWAWPPEGASLTVSPWIIPMGSRNPAVAHLWLNYVARPEVFAEVINIFAHMPPPHTAVAPFLFADVMGSMPPEGYLENCENMDPKMYTGKGLELRTAIWQELKG